MLFANDTNVTVFGNDIKVLLKESKDNTYEYIYIVNNNIALPVFFNHPCRMT